MEELPAGMVATTGLDADTVTAWVQSMWTPDAVQIRAGELGGALDPATGYFRTREWRAAEFPAANMVADARSVARMYAATVSEVDGVRLLDPATVERATAVQTDKTRMYGLPPELDIPADRSFNMSLGFWRACPPLPMAGPRSFGHPGSGGSIGFADPDAAIGFGYVTNLWNYRPDDPRAAQLGDESWYFDVEIPRLVAELRVQAGMFTGNTSIVESADVEPAPGRPGRGVREPARAALCPHCRRGTGHRRSGTARWIT